MENQISKEKWQVNGNDNLRVKDAEGRVIADCYSFSEGIPALEAEATAKAIAAVPEMLNVIHELMSDLFYQIESKHGAEKAANYPSYKKASELLKSI
jgi:hypothetical protein